MGDSTVVVTGGGAGFGRWVATAFARRDWTVVIGAETADGLDGTVAACEDEGATATGIRANVRDEFDLERLAKTAAGFGPTAGIDAVVPAADVRHGEGPIDADSYAAFDDHWRANARGVFSSIRESLPHLNDDARVLVPAPGSAADVDAGAGSYGVSTAAAAAVVRAFAADTDYAVGRVEATGSARESDDRDPESVGSVFVRAATDLPASALDGARVTPADLDESPPDA